MRHQRTSRSYAWLARPWRDLPGPRPKVVTELFADRAIDAQGLLVPRGQPRSVIHDAADVHLRLLDWLSTGHLTSIDGARVRVRARSICIHSDTPGCTGRSTRGARNGGGGGSAGGNVCNGFIATASP